MSLLQREWRYKLAARRSTVERFCLEVRQCCLTRCPAAHRFAVELLLRETLSNAVAHGKSGLGFIDCILRFRRDRFLIVVQDEGPGFDWKALKDKRAEVSETHGRGTEILRTYATRVRYSARGNAVAVLTRFGGETHE